MTIASLPMYDLPEVRRATDAWWAGLAAGFTRAGVADVPTRWTATGSWPRSGMPRTF